MNNHNLTTDYEHEFLVKSEFHQILIIHQKTIPYEIQRGMLIGIGIGSVGLLGILLLVVILIQANEQSSNDIKIPVQPNHGLSDPRNFQEKECVEKGGRYFGCPECPVGAACEPCTAYCKIPGLT